MTTKKSENTPESGDRFRIKFFDKFNAHDIDELYYMCINLSNRKNEIASEIENLLNAIEYTDDQQLRHKRGKYLTNLQNEKAALEILYNVYSERADELEEEEQES